MHSASLRNRSDKLRKSLEKEAARDRASAQMSKDDQNGKNKGKSASRPPRAAAAMYTARIRLVATALVIGLVFVYHQSTTKRSSFKSFRTGPNGYVVGSLPSVYGICTHGTEGIYTVKEGGNEQVECIVVQSKVIADVGTLATIEKKYGHAKKLGPPTASYSSLTPVSQRPLFSPPKSGLPIHFLEKGQTITPGLVDSHGHILSYGEWKSSVSLVGSKALSTILERLDTYVKDSNPSKDDWIVGMGWDQNIWTDNPTKQFPTYHDLESVPTLTGRPVILTRIDSHAVWVSKAVLKKMEPLPDTVDGGEIVRDVNGEPTGVLMDNAMTLALNVKPERTEKQMLAYLMNTLREAVSLGLVGIHDAGSSPDEISFFKKVVKKSNLPLRLYAMLLCPNQTSYCGASVPRIEEDEFDGRLVVKSIKLISDGALGSWGAALHDPYSDRDDGYKGLLLIKDQTVAPLIQEYIDGGWQINVHAIGDKANTIVLSAFEDAQSRDPTLVKRPRLEHAQILTQKDLTRIVDLGVIASFQPTHATSDMNYAEHKIGHERIKGAYAWQTVLKNGGRITLGSDFPIESLDPLKGFYSAVARLDEAGDSPHGKDGWYPEEKLSREETLKGMTLDTAYASFKENITGSLEIGKRADFVVWDRDLMQVPVGEILGAKAILTVIDGQPVWGKL